MPRKFAQYYNSEQLRQGIRIEMSYGLDRETAERVARQKLSQSPRYYKRQAALTPVYKQDRRCYRRRLKRKEDEANYNPFNQGSFFK